MRADHRHPAEVDQHVLEQLGMLAAGPNLRTGHADVDRHREARFHARRVHRVVQPVIERVLLDQRRDPHQSEPLVPRQVSHACGHAHRPLGAVHRGGDDEPAGMLIGDGEHVVGRRTRQAAREHRGVDAALVHHGDELVGSLGLDRPAEVFAAHLPRHLGRQEVHPEVDDAHESRA